MKTCESIKFSGKDEYIVQFKTHYMSNKQPHIAPLGTRKRKKKQRVEINRSYRDRKINETKS